MADATSTKTLSPAEAAAQLQAQLQPSPLVPNAPGQDPNAQIQAQMQDLMAQLKDVHTPEMISWWPLAPGWWLLAALTVALVVGSFTWWYLRRRRTAYRRAGLRLINRVDSQDLSPQLLARRLNEILKRTALAAPIYKNMGLAAAHGANWAAFLTSSCPPYTGKEALTSQLVKALYQPKASLDANAVKQFCRFWISSHQPVVINFAQTAQVAPKEVSNAAV